MRAWGGWVWMGGCDEGLRRVGLDGWMGESLRRVGLDGWMGGWGEGLR